MTANQSGESVVVPREPTPSILSAMDAHSDYLPEIDGVDLIGMYAAIVSVVDHETDSGDPQAAPSPAAGSGEFGAVASLLPTAGQDAAVLAWLVESVVSTTPNWWSLKHKWTADASKAIRFCRKQDAEAFIDLHCLQPVAVAAEHMWQAPVSPAEQVGTSAASAPNPPTKA